MPASSASNSMQGGKPYQEISPPLLEHLYLFGGFGG